MTLIIKTLIPFSWNPITLAFTQGVAGTVDLSQFLVNAPNKPITYSLSPGSAALPPGMGVAPNGTVSYNGVGPVANVTVQFRAASGQHETDSAPTQAVITGSSLGQVTGLVASAVTQTSFTLAWTAVSGALDYLVERSPTGSGSWSARGTTTGVSYGESGLTAGTAYWYRVTARNSTQTGSASAALAVTTLAAGTEPTWVTGATLAAVAPGAAFSFPLVATDAQSDPIHFSYSGPTVGTATPQAQVGANRTLTWAGTMGSSELSFTVDAGSIAAPSAELPTFAVSSASGAWSFGQVFKQGAAPAYLTASGSAQVEVRNRWPDGSVKFALLSGVNQSSVAFTATAIAPSAPGEVALSASPASVAFSGGVTGTVNCPATNTVAGWSKSTAHLVRKIAGSVMTERHYYAPTTDAHVAVWFYVRSYSNGVHEVETVVENGWVNVASPGAKSYTATVTVGSASYGPYTVTHQHHTRWSCVLRSDGSVPLTPTHDWTYARQTKLIPNFVQATPDTATIAALAYTTTTQPIPFAQGNSAGDTGMGAGGESETDWKGLLPHYDAVAVASGHAGAIRNAVHHAAVYGRWNIYYREETTGTLGNFLTTPVRYLGQNQGVVDTASATTVVPTPTGSSRDFARSHHPAPSYVAYLITGRWPALEVGHALVNTYLRSTNAFHAQDGFSWIVRGYAQLREFAWGLRSLAMAYCATPDNHPDVLWFKRVWDDSIQYANFKKPAASPLGIARFETFTGDYSDMNYTGFNGTFRGQSMFMQHYSIMAASFAYDLGLSSRTEHLAYLTHLYKWPVGLFGRSNAGQWNYRNAIAYIMPAAVTIPGSYDITTWYTWAQAYAAFSSSWGATAGYVASADTADNQTIFETPNSTDGASPPAYLWSWTMNALNPTHQTWAAAWAGQAAMCLIMAKDHGASGADAAYARMINSPSYPVSGGPWLNAPKYGVVPR